MGNCISQSKIKAPRKQIQKQIQSEHSKSQEKKALDEKKYGIKNQKVQKLLKFEYAPLANNQFLYNKFHHDSNRPDEINLEWQIAKAEYSQNNLKICIINHVPLNIWIVMGGKEKKSMTGLLIEIQNYSFCELRPVSSISSNQNTVREMEWRLSGKRNEEEKVRVILQSTSDPSQTLHMIYTYSIREGQIRLENQELMWNNLAFQLESIYNGNQSQTQCVICNEQPSSCIMIPCKHMCLCKNCLHSFKRIYHACPLCKKDFTEIVIYKDVK